ncbi:hypothetical protein ACQW5G_00500 [Fructilactobacillus sp. Tb1]|uniref:hypothetical protein n=1 Tax=Fructilactobacillus sp. Tb1 TaxID=3422304 RepID=UPI003D28CDD0
MELFKKQMFQNFGVMPSDLGKQNYFDMLDMLNAKEEKERPMDAKDAGMRLSSLL